MATATRFSAHAWRHNGSGSGEVADRNAAGSVTGREMSIATSPVPAGRRAATCRVNGLSGSISGGSARRLISFIAGASSSASRLIA